MTSIIIKFLLIFIGYIFGLFQTGWFLGKMMNVNLKNLGSGNTGATNALRVMGLKGGLIVLVGDALKSFIPCMAVKLIFSDLSVEALNAYILYTGLGCVLGNNYPFYLKFNGGKGVAVSLGWILAWYPKAAIICMIIFLVFAVATRYASVASITCCLAVVAITHLFASKYFGPLQTLSADGVEFVILGLVIPLLVIARHHDNIERLIHRTENRFGKK